MSDFDFVSGLTLQQQRPTFPSTTETSNFYAPFFQAVFYRVESETPADEDGRFPPPDGDTQTINEFLANRNIGSLRDDNNKPTRFRLNTVGGVAKTYVADQELEGVEKFSASLVIEAKSAAAYKATLVMTPPYEDALRIVDSGAIDFGTVMEVQWGYMNPQGARPIISDKGLFSIVEPSVSLGVQTTITLSGYDLLSSSAGSIERRCAWPRGLYPSDFEIIRQILKIHGRELDMRELHVNSLLLMNRPGKHMVQNTSDEIFVKTLLLQNNARLVPNDSGGFVVYDVTERESAPITYRLLMFGQPGGAGSVAGVVDIPMISYQSNSIMSLFAGKGSRGVRSVTHDPNTNSASNNQKVPKIRTEQQTVASPTPKSGAFEKQDASTNVGDRKVAPFKKLESGPTKNCASGYFVTYPASAPNNDKEEEQRVIELERTANTHADVVIPGHPTILPLMNVKVEGVGQKFGGIYRVMEVTHEIGAGYTTKLRLFVAANRAPPADAENRPREEQAAQQEPVRLSDAAEKMLPPGVF